RLDALETVFPWNDEPQRCAVLIGKRLAVEADGQNGEWMHRFVEPQAFDIGPLENREKRSLVRHLVGPQQGLQGDVLGAAQRLDSLEKLGERKADPRDHHRPALDAAVAVNPLLERHRLDYILQRVVGGPGDKPVDLHLPWLGREGVSIGSGIALVNAKLI